MRSIFHILLLSIALLLGPAMATTTIEGTVTGQDGKTPALVHVELLPLSEQLRLKPLQSMDVRDGHFKLQIDDNSFYTLHIAAVNHYDFNIPLLPSAANEHIQLQIQPRGYNYKSDFKDIQIIGDWNKFSMRGGEAMQQQSDGTFTYERPTTEKQTAYQLLYVENEEHSINGTQADSYIYDGGGDFRSVIATQDGMFRVTFDPAKLTRPGNNKLRITVKGDDAYAQAIDLTTRYNDALRESTAKMRQYARTHSNNMQGFSYDNSKIKNRLHQAMAQTANPLLKRLAAIDLSFFRPDSQTALQITRITSLSDRLWDIFPMNLSTIYQTAYGKQKGMAMLLTRSDKIKAPYAKGMTLAMGAYQAMSNGDKALQKKLYDQVKDEFGNDPNFQPFLSRINPDMRIAVGKEVPEFKVTLLHSDKTVSRESLKGHYYMIDFWAVWCGPCRGEMPGLDAAYKKFKDKNFRVLSLSFDARESDIDKYRKEKWPMPWMHSFLKGGFRNPISKKFEVSGIPKPILVDPNGKIIATGMALRGENLEKTLAKYLK